MDKIKLDFFDYLDDKEFDYLMKLNNKDKFFVWFYCPIDFIKIETIIDLYKQLKIPSNLFLIKLIHNLVLKEYDFDKIMKFLTDEKILDTKDIDENIKMIIKMVKNKKINRISSEIIKEILKHSKSYKLNYIDNIHVGYPLPHPEFGRPKLHWPECRYEGCDVHNKNGYYDDLKYDKDNNYGYLEGMGIGNKKIKDHLKKIGKFTPGFHKCHEEIVLEMELTPKKIIDLNINRCPSIVCNKNDYIFTPQELCTHFMLLGIPPFWQKGLEIKNPKKEKDIIINSSSKTIKIYSANECSICWENDPSIIFFPCNHYIVCLQCHNMNEGLKKCPVCRKNIEKILLY